MAIARPPRLHAQKKTGHASEQERADVRAKRQRWFDQQDDLMPARLIFLDEFGTNTKMARTFGRSKRGQRCRASIPHGHWKTTTLVAGLSLDGIVAPMIFDGAMDGDMFRAYVSHLLVNVLRPGDIVICDALPAHKVSGIKECLELAGARLLFLPPYSPDFNPIENAFSQIKAILKNIAARTRQELQAAITTAIDAVSSQNAKNYFKACGYEGDTA
jgi:transposase